VQNEYNVRGTKLKPCCTNPITGWARDGYCTYHPEDRGLHVVCVEITQHFLDFSKAHGNDLSTPKDGFSGVKAGDKWCVCLLRVIEAFNAGVRLKVDLEATSIYVREVIPLEFLEQMAQV
jgi:hypothetical protein